MDFNSKQLEELENLSDATGIFEDDVEEESGFDDMGEAAMDWRTSLIEEAAENVKRSKTRPVDSLLTYTIGSMLYDREVRRFARVRASIPGYLKIVYLSGGDREYGTFDATQYLREYGSTKRVSELSLQLGMQDVDVVAHLERLAISPLDEIEDPEPVADVTSQNRHASPSKPTATNHSQMFSAASTPVQAKDKFAGKSVPKSSPSQNALKQTQQGKNNTGKQTDTATHKLVSGIDPVRQPNEYIKAHYQNMSNRDLAKETGLSEHTIRRKLGEWGLKRVKG